LKIGIRVVPANAPGMFTWSGLAIPYPRAILPESLRRRVERTVRRTPVFSRTLKPA
jgi:hypothetical protein